MDKLRLLKMIYEHELTALNNSGSSPSLEDFINDDKKIKKLITMLVTEQLITSDDGKPALTNMGRYLAKIL